MVQQFVMEAILAATYGHLLVPAKPIHYIVPYSTISELYEIREGDEPVMVDPDDDQLVKSHIQTIIQFFEEPLNRKKIDRALQAPWRESAPLLLKENVQFTIINAVDNAQYGDLLDPIETELVLVCMRKQMPLLTDQYELQEKLIEAEVPIQLYDIDDFEFAIEEGLSAADIEKLYKP